MVKDRGTKLVRHIRNNVAGYIALTLALSLSPAIANHLNVQTSDLANNAVTRPKIDNNAVNGAKIAPLPEARTVGTAGQPAFSDGGEGDCEWEISPDLVGPHFYRDQLGFVHLGGFAGAKSGTGGDAVCNRSAPNEAEDGFLFRLPAGLRPVAPLQFGHDSGGGVAIFGKEDVQDGPLLIPAGSVYIFSDSGVALLDGISFRTDMAPTGGPAGSSTVEGTFERILGR